jgi:hypothetical protein
VSPARGGGARRILARFGADPRVDYSTVGINFVDVLFALVVGIAVEPLGTWWEIPLAGWWHLAVAAVITLTSWVGYHYSANRPRFAIGFPNLPLVQFVLDIGMVVVYGLTVFTAEGVLADRGANAEPTALPEAWLVTVAFGLYVVWDVVGRAILGAPEYRAAWERAQAERRDLVLPDMRRPWDDDGRRWVTRACLIAAAGILWWAWQVDSRAGGPSERTVVRIDVALIALLVLYRTLKEVVSEPRSKAA